MLRRHIALVALTVGLLFPSLSVPSVHGQSVGASVDQVRLRLGDLPSGFYRSQYANPVVLPWAAKKYSIDQSLTIEFTLAQKVFPKGLFFVRNSVIRSTSSAKIRSLFETYRGLTYHDFQRTLGAKNFKWEYIPVVGEKAYAYSFTVPRKGHTNVDMTINFVRKTYRVSVTVTGTLGDFQQPQQVYMVEHLAQIVDQRIVSSTGQ